MLNEKVLGFFLNFSLIQYHELPICSKYIFSCDNIKNNLFQLMKNDEVE